MTDSPWREAEEEYREQIRHSPEATGTIKRRVGIEVHGAAGATRDKFILTAFIDDGKGWMGVILGQPEGWRDTSTKAHRFLRQLTNAEAAKLVRGY